VEHSTPLLRDLNLESRALYADWAEQANGTGLGFRSSGLLMLHKTEKGRTKDLKDAEYARKAGLDIRVLDAGEVHDHTSHLPPSVQGGVYYAQDGLVDPTRVIDTLTHELSEQGATLRPEVAVTGFDHSHGSIQRIRTTDGVVEADEVVLAAGSWSAPLSEQLGLDVPIQPAKGYSVTYDVPNGRPGAPYILTEEKVSVTPMGERVRFAGTLELAGFDASVDPYRLAPILDVANEYPLRGGPTSPSTAEPWVGFRPCTPDGLPIIGPVSAYDNLMLATGHGMMGVSLAPITGRLVAEMLNEESPVMDIEPLRLQRFN
jgi:D-amino-acid dehydrogenase